MSGDMGRNIAPKTTMLETILDSFSLQEDAKSIISQSIETSKDYSDFLNYYSTQVSPALLLIGEGEEARAFLDRVQTHKKISYQVALLSAKDILSVSGSLGDFEAKINLSGKNDVAKVAFSQAVIFYEDDYLTRFMGIEKVSDFEDEDELLELLDSRIGQYIYEKKINYNSNFCQYFHRRPDKQNQGYCHKCADVCPTFGVGKDDSLMELVFSKIDCIGCGNCVCVCPSGALQRDGYDKEAIFEIAKLYKNKTPVVLDETTFRTLRDFDFSSCVPLVLPQVNFLNEMYLLTLIQESSSPIIIFTNEASKYLLDSIKLINSIYEAIYSKEVISLPTTQEELSVLCQSTTPDTRLFYTYAQTQTEALREIFAQRLLFMIKNENYGQIKNTGTSTYGEISVDTSVCTLCMSCVGACNVRSLSGDCASFSLRFNASSCTACGYCVDSCPEKAITLNPSGILLGSSWFENKILAQDKMFECIECHKPFASYKSIEKIKSIMTPLFQNDPAKIRSLQCCADCKVKVMFENSMKEMI